MDNEKRKQQKRDEYQRNKLKYAARALRWRCKNRKYKAVMDHLWYIKNIKHKRQYDKNYWIKNKQKKLKAAKEYRKTLRGKAAEKRYQAKISPLIKQARRAVSNALRDGYIKRQPCYICQKIINCEAHHKDYTKFLDVIWLCKEHHQELHNTQRRNCG